MGIPRWYHEGTHARTGLRHVTERTIVHKGIFCARVNTVLLVLILFYTFMMHGGKKCGGHMFGWVLVIIGALNWGLVGAFQYNLVDSIFGMGSTVARIVYVLVGLAGLMLLVGCRCKTCTSGACNATCCATKESK